MNFGGSGTLSAVELQCRDYVQVIVLYVLHCRFRGEFSISTENNLQASFDRLGAGVGKSRGLRFIFAKILLSGGWTGGCSSLKSGALCGVRGHRTGSELIRNVSGSSPNRFPCHRACTTARHRPLAPAGLNIRGNQ